MTLFAAILAYLLTGFVLQFVVATVLGWTDDVTSKAQLVATVIWPVTLTVCGVVYLQERGR